MLKHIYKGISGVLLIGLAACSTAQFEEDALTPGTTPIQLTGAVTRTAGNSNLEGYSDLHLSALTTDDADFFKNIKITEVTTNSDTKSDLEATVYYPINKAQAIKLYGHTGEATDRSINLTSGTATANDAIISNGTNGNGTSGSANSPVPLLTFRHVMTKVTVKIEVDDSDIEEAKPADIEIGFANNKVAGSGKYALTAATAQCATGISGSYKLQGSTGEGTDNYLVPTGETLSGTGFITSLKIDDYTATQEDLKALTIPQASLNGASSNLTLNPGEAYTLTFKIKRLKVQEITLKKSEWAIKDGNGEWGYTPYKVKMNVTGEYDNSGDKLLSKIVLRYTPDGEDTDTYQYIGSGEADGDNGGTYAHFVTLPEAEKMTDGTLEADLYTQNGLLIAGHTLTYVAEDGNTSPQFNIDLGSNGMVKDDDGYYQVSTPLQFYHLMTTPKKDEKYRLTSNMDINSLPLAITPTDFPENAELDCDGHSILHLNLKGSGLFKTNNGTLKNIHITFSSIDASGSGDLYAGSICSINNGTIEGCINEADIKAKAGQTVGGICGKNNNGKTILACLNTGNIPEGTKIGGICGDNASTAANAIKACVNTGMLHKSSNTEGAAGGICGYQSAASGVSVIGNCYWLTGTASNNQTFNDEKAIGSFAGGIAEESQNGYSDNNTTNMTETLLRTEAIDKLNTALGSGDWKFEWKQDADGTYKTVWPIPVKTANP